MEGRWVNTWFGIDEGARGVGNVLCLDRGGTGVGEVR